MSAEMTSKDRSRRMGYIRAGITAGGIALNVLLAWVVHTFDLPLYLDTIGTIVVAGECGTAWGIMAALVTNILCSSFDPSSMYYSIVNIAMAMGTASMFFKGRLEKKSGILRLILHLTLISGLLGSLLTWVLYGGPNLPFLQNATNAFSAATGVDGLPALLITNLAINLLDKSITVMGGLIIINLIPEDFRNEMLQINMRIRRAAGLDRPAKDLDKQSGAARHRRLLIMIAAMAITLTTVIAWISMSLYTETERAERADHATDAANLAVAVIDPDQVDSFLTEGSSAPGYQETKEKLATIFANSCNVKYLYVYQMRRDGIHVVFDLDSTSDSLTEPGTVIEYEEGLGNMVGKLQAGEEVEPFETDDYWGWLLSDYEPIYNSEGRCVAYAGADVSLEDLSSHVMDFLFRIFLIGTGFLVLAVAFGMRVSADYHRADEWQAMLKKQEQERQLTKEIIEAFAKTIDMKDHYTNGHSFRVARYTFMLAHELGLDDDTADQYYGIALLHDIGKISIPVEVLNKPGDPTDEEYELIKSHAQKGYDALKDISLMPDLAIGAGSHHERVDGQGYPQGLKGDEVPQVAKIIAVADTFDAMYSDRPYRPRMEFENAVSIIKEVSGTQLDTDVVDAFMRLVERGDIR